MRSSTLTSFSFLAVLAGFSSAGLYPTQPVADTVFRGGAWNTVTWIDSDASESQPSLDALGELDINLWVDDGSPRPLATLATNVDPRKLSQNVYIPADVWENASNYFIRFEGTNPPTSIYTADFSITNMNGNRTAYPDGKVRQATTSAAATGTAFNSGNPSSTRSSLSVAASDAGAYDLVTVTMETTAQSARTPQETKAGAVAAMENGTPSGGRHLRSSSMKFNLVFVLFPALFGLSLAL